MEWTHEDFVVSIGENRSKKGEVSKNTFDSWRKGKTFPQNDNQRALFKTFWPRGRLSDPKSFDTLVDALARAKAEKRFIRRERNVAPTSVDFVQNSLPRNLISFLGEIGVDPVYFSPSYPGHISEISHSIEEFLRKSPEYLPTCRSYDVLIRISDYPSSFGGEFQAKHIEYFRTLKQFESFYPQIGEFRAKKEQFVGSLLEDSTLPSKKKVVIASSFFYVSDSRKDSWGVIPVGMQRAFAIIFSQKFLDQVFGYNTSPKAVDSMFSDVISHDRLSASLSNLFVDLELPAYGFNWTSASALSFLVRILRHVFSVRGQIIVRRGYVQGDLLLQMLSNAGLPDMASKAQDALTFSRGIDEAAFELFEPGTTEFDDNTDCALFDIGQIDRVLEGIKSLRISNKESKFCIFLLRHSLNTPVGIGFSLPLLPFMLKRLKWPGMSSEAFLYNALQSAALRIYTNNKDSSIVESFMKIGIDLVSYDRGTLKY